MGRLEKELIKARESVAHHRQKAVEARLELQEMKGTYKAKNGSIGHLNQSNIGVHTHTQRPPFFLGSSSLRASRLRRSAKLEEEKKIEERNFTMPTKGKRKRRKSAPMTGPSEEELRKLEKDLESQEMLLQGLNKENQKMAEEAKQAKLEHEETQRRMFEEHERLNKVINNLTQQLQLGDTATSAHKRAMELEEATEQRCRDWKIERRYRRKCTSMAQ